MTLYRVIAISRALGTVVNRYQGESAMEATATYEDLIKRKTFMGDFKVKLQRLDAVDVMESE